MKMLIAVLRAAVAVATIVAIVATTLDTASRTPINPFNFFGYFTIQSNIITSVALLLAAFATFAGRRQTPGLQLLRAAATTYIVIVGLVYNTLLAGLPGGVELEWANTIMHVIMPLYAAIDWLLFGDRRALAWKRLWLVLIYPVVWLAVVLVRGATDGWVPYPFLDPSQGYGVVALFALGIAGAFGIVGALVWALSRVRLLRP